MQLPHNQRFITGIREFHANTTDDGGKDFRARRGGLTPSLSPPPHVEREHFYDASLQGGIQRLVWLNFKAHLVSRVIVVDPRREAHLVSGRGAVRFGNVGLEVDNRRIIADINPRDVYLIPFDGVDLGQGEADGVGTMRGTRREEADAFAVKQGWCDARREAPLPPVDPIPANSLVTLIPREYEQDPHV